MSKYSQPGYILGEALRSPIDGMASLRLVGVGRGLTRWERLRIRFWWAVGRHARAQSIMFAALVETPLPAAPAPVVSRTRSRTNPDVWL